MIDDQRAEFTELLNYLKGLNLPEKPITVFKYLIVTPGDTFYSSCERRFVKDSEYVLTELRALRAIVERGV